MLINHVDADSLLSSLIMAGILKPNEEFGQAAIAADHTGEENAIADLLQAIQIFRDVDFSARNLELLLRGEELDPKAAERLLVRLADREMAKEMVDSGAFEYAGSVAYTALERKIDAGFLPSLLPGAAVILTFSPMKDDPTKNEVKIRLGQAVPAGTSLHDLGITDFDPGFGGRWNAGSNKRGGGTELSPAEYAEKLDTKLQEYLAKQS
jgi:hypothetical protein